MLETNPMSYVASSSERAPPRIVDPSAEARFRALVTSMDLDPDDPWIGSAYIDHEWYHGRHAFAAAPSLNSSHILEFGCNVGATAVILAALGAHVTAVDVDERCVQIARLNAERYGVADRVAFHHLPDTRALPFGAGTFDVISCNSVLEYVPAPHLAPVQRELDRVLRPGGTVVVLGTSNRAWPRELHSGLLGINYLPRGLANRLARRPIRSVSPREVRGGFETYQDLSLIRDSSPFLAMKARTGTSPRKLRLFAAAGAALAPFGVSVGMLMPSLSLFLRKPTTTVGLA
jgi:2-polyprenyl-3-methyl-5-hydroxy-6-metoxy-1,4-benzoquinol methylase